MAMAMVTMWKLLVVVMAMAFVVQSGSAQPVSRTAPYSVTINAGTNAAPAIVLATQNYIVSLEGNPCAITIRHLFSSQIAHLLWTANYYVGSLYTSTKCTLKFTTSGDLQLYAFVQGDQMIWHSDTAGKGIVKMALENSFDSGNLELLTAANVIKYQSFDVKEFAILPTQKFKNGETLVAANDFNNDTVLQILFSGNHYHLKLQSGDLRLFSDFGKGLKQYWSLKKTLAKNVDLSQVAYASMVLSEGGIGLFKSDGTLVWTSGPISFLQSSNPHDTYFSVDPDGNLRTYALYKGQFWAPDFVAIPNLCDLPNSCGEFGVCSNSTCSCLPQWVRNNANDPTQGCKTSAPFQTCGSGKQQFRTFAGYDYVYNQYATGLTTTTADCESKCLADCNCAAYFYNANSPGLCYLTNEVRTLKKVADTKLTVHIKV